MKGGRLEEQGDDDEEKGETDRTVLVLDVDGTLYGQDTGLESQVRRRTENALLYINMVDLHLVFRWPQRSYFYNHDMQLEITSSTMQPHIFGSPISNIRNTATARPYDISSLLM